MTYFVKSAMLRVLVYKYGTVGTPQLYGYHSGLTDLSYFRKVVEMF
jgi:hypothetical protein